MSEINGELPPSTWSNPAKIPDAVYKFVEPSFADGFAEGRLRIGTFRDYAKLDNERMDENEATVTRLVDHALFEAGNPHAEKLGITVTDQAKVWVTGGTFAQTIPNRFCFCMALSPDAKPKKPAALFKINDVSDFLKKLTGYNFSKLGPAIEAGAVAYTARRGNYDDPALRGANPFMKELSFSWEQEFRVVWNMPNGLDPRGQSSNDVSAFVTEPNADVASHIHRL